MLLSTVLINCPCGVSPILRHDENRGLFLYVCTGCKYHSEPSSNEYTARARWNRDAGDIRPCLGCGSRPRLRKSKLRNMWTFVCTGCGWRGHPVHTSDGAFVSWHRANLPNDEHVWGLWRVRYHELQEQLEETD